LIVAGDFTDGGRAPVCGALAARRKSSLASRTPRHRRS